MSIAHKALSQETERVWRRPAELSDRKGASVNAPDRFHQPPRVKIGHGDASGSHPNRHSLQVIPIADPAAALRFCQALADMVAPAQKPYESVRPVSRPAAASDAKNAGPALSIVLPVFNEAENIDTLHSRLTAVLEEVRLDAPAYGITVAPERDGRRAIA